MQTTVAALLLVVSSVILACIVVDYAVNIVQATLETTNIPQLDRLKNIQNAILNQTDYMFNQTIPITEPILQSTPAPALVLPP